MIRVTPAPESASFHANVRARGALFLAGTPRPTTREFELHSYWKNSRDDLYFAYQKTCAYSCAPIWVRNAATVDHYLTKSLRPDLAYEWSNYRLSRYKLNSNKGVNPRVLDPFLIEDHWFEVDFPSCLIKPGAGLSPEVLAQVEETIDCLRLNDDDELVDERAAQLIELANGDISFAKLQREYPLLAKEVERQKILGQLPSIFKKLPAS